MDLFLAPHWWPAIWWRYISCTFSRKAVLGYLEYATSWIYSTTGFIFLLKILHLMLKETMRAPNQHKVLWMSLSFLPVLVYLSCRSLKWSWIPTWPSLRFNCGIRREHQELLNRHRINNRAEWAYTTIQNFEFGKITNTVSRNIVKQSISCINNLKCLLIHNKLKRNKNTKR